MKHGIHINHTRRNPTADVLVKCGGTFEHPGHFCHFRRIPIEVVVKGGGLMKHAAHIGHTRRNPTADGLVKCGGSHKHVLKGRHSSRLPVLNGGVARS